MGAAVSVVLPTHRRPQDLARALRSALDQTLPAYEVIVVVDGSHPPTMAVLKEFSDPRIVVIEHPVALGAGAARNAGIRQARGDFIAFLDDDDWWYPRKLETQVRAHLSSPAPELTVSGTAGHVDHEGNVVVWPLRAPRTAERIADYLFVRRRAGEGALYTPSLMVPASLAQAVPMPTHLATHEEWDWLLSLQDRGVRAVVEMTPLGRFDTSPRQGGSISSQASWSQSLAWADSRRETLGPRAYAAFVLTEVGRGAAQAGAGPAIMLRLLRHSLRGRPRPWDVGRHLMRPLVRLLRARRSERPGR